MSHIADNFAYYLGVFKRVWDIVSLPICVLLFAIYIFTYKPTQVTNVFPPVVVINKDGSSIRLLNDNSEEAYRSAAIFTSQRVARVIFGYSNDGQYASNAADLSKVIQENSPASRTYRDIVQKNLTESKKSSSIFTPDQDGVIASLDPKNKGIMVVILHGYQTVTTSSGTTSSKVTINFTMYFNEKRGEDGEVFKISDFNFNN